MDCIFCKIIKGEIPSHKIYEDDHTLAFLDISKDHYGHTLIVPKTHHENLFDISPEALSKVMNTAKKIACHYRSLGFDGVNVINNNGASAEQSVFHLHLHLFPRKSGDNIKLFPDLKSKDYDLKEIQEKLKM